MKAIVLAGLIGASALASQALADTYLETTCSSSRLNGSEVYCDQGAIYNHESDGTSTIYALRLTAPATHCSPVKYVVAFPPPPPPAPDEIVAIALPTTPLEPVEVGHNHIGRTGVLQPGESAVVDLGRGYARGSTPLMIMVIGMMQDCNVGQLHNWGVHVEPVIVPE